MDIQNVISEDNHDEESVNVSKNNILDVKSKNQSIIESILDDYSVQISDNN